ncbi:energy-coupling factor transport system ATP-binding protein [Micromonospora pattaloongensis]|uniref:Energy-coupling factor transport system ATP-binding protein n=1 Tax=Micromonospora pattaloongensis TaxID=405436 RepID=A0A1H3RJX9_9ACTN|nr:ABC transporter ATP-binding protein [Micromonospora pattaloongensis]SDZ25913.1 energy-coupling factor transport system ATP-binding protein [Micromonospora pattaloongensis]
MGAVELRGFGWRHAGRKAWAVRGVDLRIEHGERVLLLGPSGAGKSTLLAALAGLLPEDSGEQKGTAEIDGLDPRKARERVGMVFQDPETQLVMARCGDDVAFGLENRGVPAEEIWPRVDEALRRVGFPYGRDRPTAALSGGEQQRLALAGTLALRPDLLLLDEPTANLDPVGATLVREAVAGAVRGDTTLILVEHRVAEALPLVDRVVVLTPGGGVTADGPPDAVFAAHGEALAAAGVWVPGRPVQPRRATAPTGDTLITAERLGLPPRLRPTDLTVRAGEALAVLGPNGAGKSTLALLLGGLVKPGVGRVVATSALAGRDAGTPPHRWRAPALATRIGSVFQDPEHQFVTRTVFDELALGPRRTGRSEAETRSVVNDLLVRLRLDRLAGANPYTLSGGEARRLGVATALATAPRLLVLDEPTFGQDRRTWLELVELLAGLRDAGHGIVTVTHDAEFVASLADRHVALERSGTR